MSDAILTACPACSTLNRVPREKLAHGPAGKCGQCGGPLFEGHPLALNGQTFEVHAAKSDIPLLVDFWAPWCGPCRAMAPHFEKAAAALEPGVRLAKVNTDEEQDLASRFSIRGIPTIVLLSKGREVARHSGLMDAAGIRRWVQQSLV
jgi:thioredoxin 2